MKLPNITGKHYRTENTSHMRGKWNLFAMAMLFSLFSKEKMQV
jgi:hypothetical protein